MRMRGSNLTGRFSLLLCPEQDAIADFVVGSMLKMESEVSCFRATTQACLEFPDRAIARLKSGGRVLA